MVSRLTANGVFRLPPSFDLNVGITSGLCCQKKKKDKNPNRFADSLRYSHTVFVLKNKAYFKQEALYKTHLQPRLGII